MLFEKVASQQGKAVSVATALGVKVYYFKPGIFC